MKLILIGGGEVGRNDKPYETETIDKEIVDLTGKEHPNFLFIGFASSSSDSYYDLMKKIYKNLGCECVNLKRKNAINNPDIVKSKINAADIIYIGGGDTLKLLDDVKEFGIDELLREAANRGCVIAGISAGAILLSKSGFSDSYILRGEDDKYSFIDGLGFCDLNICPHYHRHEKKDEELYTSLKNNKSTVYGLENCTALKVVDGNIAAIKSKDDAKAYLVSYSDKLIEKVL